MVVGSLWIQKCMIFGQFSMKSSSILNPKVQIDLFLLWVLIIYGPGVYIQNMGANCYPSVKHIVFAACMYRSTAIPAMKREIFCGMYKNTLVCPTTQGKNLWALIFHHGPYLRHFAHFANIAITCVCMLQSSLVAPDPQKKGSGETVYKNFSVRNFNWMMFTLLWQHRFSQIRLK